MDMSSSDGNICKYFDLPIRPHDGADSQIRSACAVHTKTNCLTEGKEMPRAPILGSR
jgi:hypothetical protein